MQPFAIVIPFDPVHDVQARLGPRFIVRLVNPFYLQRLKEALHRRIVPGIGASAHRHRHAEVCGQLPVRPAGMFTSQEFTQLLKENGIAISMDGRGCWRDNVFVERLWKSIKYEEVYLRAYETVSAARSGIARYIDFYNSRRPHSSLDAMTPDAFYFKHLPFMQRAA
jgi:transposase InsO family protein